MSFDQCCENFIATINSFSSPETLSFRDVAGIIERLESLKTCNELLSAPTKLTTCFNGLIKVLFKYSAVRVDDESYVAVVRNVLEVVLSVLDKHKLHTQIFPYFVMIINRFVSFKHPPLKEILKAYNVLVSKVSPSLITENDQGYVLKLYELAKSSNIELQAAAIELQLKLYYNAIPIERNMEELFNFFDVKSTEAIANAYPFIRIALDHLNSDSEVIFSQNCSKIAINSQRIVEFEGCDEEDGIYLDIDVKSRKISFFCEEKTLKSLFHVNFATSWEVISFFATNVESFRWQNLPEVGIQILLQIKRKNFIILSDTQDESIVDLEIICELNSKRFTEFTKDILPQIFPHFSIEVDSEQLILSEVLSSPIITRAKNPKTYKAPTQKPPIKISRKSKRNDEEKERFGGLKPGAKSLASSRSSLSFSDSVIGKARKEDIQSKVSAKIKEHNSSQELKIKKGSYSELLVKSMEQHSESSIVENWLKVCPDPDLETMRCENLREAPCSSPSQNKEIDYNLSDGSNTILNISNAEDICEIALPPNKTEIDLNTLPAEKDQKLDDFDKLSHVSNSSTESGDRKKCRYATRSKTRQYKKPEKKLPIGNPKRLKYSLSTISERTEKTARKTAELDEIIAGIPERARADETFVKEESLSNNSNSTSTNLEKKSSATTNIEDNHVNIAGNTLIDDKTVQVTEETVCANNATRLTEVSMEIEQTLPDKAPACLYPSVTVLNEDNFDQISYRDTSSPVRVGPKRTKRRPPQSSFDKIEVVTCDKPAKRKAPPPVFDKASTIADNASSVFSETKTEGNAASVANKNTGKRKLFDNSAHVSDLTRSPEKRIDLEKEEPVRTEKKAAAKTRKNATRKKSPAKRKKRGVKRLDSSYNFARKSKSNLTYDNLFDSMLEEHKVYLKERAVYQHNMGIQKSSLSPDEFEEFQKCLEPENKSSSSEPRRIQILSNIVLKKGDAQNCEECQPFRSTLNSLLQQFHAGHSK